MLASSSLAFPSLTLSFSATPSLPLMDGGEMMNVKTAADVACQSVKIQVCYAQAAGAPEFAATIQVQLADRSNLADLSTV